MLLGCDKDVSKRRPSRASLAASGGDATTHSNIDNAFGQAVPNLTREERRAFSVGNNLFSDNWVTAPASTTGRDGLGPLFNAQSCSSCHQDDGRGSPPLSDDDPTRGLLLRISLETEDGTSGDPIYGTQLQDRAILGVEPEGKISISRRTIRGMYSDGEPYELEAPEYQITQLAYGPLTPGFSLSPRIAPAIFGVGLLEAIPEETILSRADLKDFDDDGISGRPNMVLNESGKKVVGRFGWKANVATVNQQNAAAFHGDIGITSSLHREEHCTEAQSACRSAPTGGDPELSEEKLQRVTFYSRALAVPARRNVSERNTQQGEKLFTNIGCSACHTPEVTTGRADIADLSEQTIRPYSDLLLHDMGKDLSDGTRDGLATATEWRTPPLWGIGLVESVNGHTRFLHDGRARSLEEAILWHGGEAKDAKDKFTRLSSDDRKHVLEFLESL